MKVTQHIENTKGKPLFSFEIVPPQKGTNIKDLYTNIDPLMEFKHEAFALFDRLSLEIKQEIAHALFKFTIVMPENFVEPVINKRPPLIDLSQITPSGIVKPI